MSFEHCHVCKPPVRHPGCHSECSYYQEDLAKAKEYAAQKEAEYHAGDDFLTARGFKTRRGRDMRRQKDEMETGLHEDRLCPRRNP
jgi:hypothetical protein|nr:MAG TPA: hypothetical protein [Caudoviricetes sp.]